MLGEVENDATRVVPIFIGTSRAAPSPDLHYQSTFVNRCVRTLSFAVIRSR